MSGTRIPKSFEERRKELISALSILRHALVMFNKTKEISWLREIAVQLRALLIYVEGSSSFKHPLLIELASEKNFSLTVYMSNLALLRESENNLETNLKPTFSFGEEMFSLESETWRTKLSVEKAIKLPYIAIRRQKYTPEDIIRMVADTEGSHYDPERPEGLEILSRVEILGIPSAYNCLLELGFIVRDLGDQFISASS